MWIAASKRRDSVSVSLTTQFDTNSPLILPPPSTNELGHPNRSETDTVLRVLEYRTRTAIWTRNSAMDNGSKASTEIAQTTVKSAELATQKRIRF